jgi:ATP-dependent helicase/nuclease subunit A
MKKPVKPSPPKASSPKRGKSGSSNAGSSKAGSSKPGSSKPGSSDSGAFSRRVIRASAGTGKTFQLSGHYLRLLDADAQGDQILATTFTRKAAGEILDRVLLRLADAGLDDTCRLQLAQQLEDPDLHAARCLELLKGLATNLHRLRVGTLDSFFAQLAKTFSLELKLPPGWQVVDDLEDKALRGEAIEGLLLQDDTQTTLQLVHLLTKGEANRSVGVLMRDTVDKLYSLYQETQHEAWQQLPRTKPLSPAELERTVDQLRKVAMASGRQTKSRDADCEKASAEQWPSFISVGLAAKRVQGLEDFDRKPIPPEAIQLYDRLLDHARAELVGQLARQTEGTWQLLDRFHVHYQRLKQQRRALRFEDVTRYLAAGFAASSEVSSGDPAGDLSGDSPGGKLRDVASLAFRLDAHLEHLLLDEFQDTSPEQWQVIRPFAQRVVSEPSRSFFCVGDVKQAIYGWRGGAAEIFDCLIEELPGLAQGQLNRSYRSSPAVIDLVNQVFSRLEQHTNLDRYGGAVQRWVEQFPRHETALQDLPGYASLETAPMADSDQAQTEVVWDYTAQRVAQLNADAAGRGIGVLVRSNDAVGQLISRLRRLGIDASEEGGNPLTDAASVQLILSLLRLADHPGNRVARFHVLHSPLAGLVGLNGSDSSDAWRVSVSVRRQLMEEGYGSVVNRWAGGLAKDCNRREWNRLKQLVEMAYEFQGLAGSPSERSTRPATLRANRFVQWVETRRVADPTAAAVRVMTVHQSKGLEFDIVVLPQLDARLVGQPDWFVVERPRAVEPVDAVCRYASQDLQQLLPVRFQQMFDRQIDRSVTESLCVLYVALTRAAQALYMIIAPSAANERSLPKTMSGLVRAALVGANPLPAESRVFEVGDPRWFVRAATDPDAQAVKQAIRPSAGPLVVTLAPALKRRRRGLEAVSPSGLEGAGSMQLADVLDSKRGDALRRGTVIHAWFEQITWLEEGVPNRDALLRVARNLPGVRDQAAESLELWLDQFQTYLNQPVVADALRRGSYPPLKTSAWSSTVRRTLSKTKLRFEVENERTFALRQEDQLLSGTIDRLVWIYQEERLVAAEIIDFKTDMLAADDSRRLAERVEFYRPQMAAYRRAVSQLAGLPGDCVAVRLLFVQADRQEFVAD